MNDNTNLVSVVEIDDVWCTAQDVFYTIAQNYPLVMVAETAFINSRFPDTAVATAFNRPPNPETLKLSGAGFYFDPEGEFLFQGETELNPARAISEFKELVAAGKLIRGPVLTMYQVVAEALMQRSAMGHNKILYFYNTV